jgi:cellulose synthase/poly-beta-1,6-N-acetylglucosamine synthase-like glycosyltransferase
MTESLFFWFLIVLSAAYAALTLFLLHGTSRLRYPKYAGTLHKLSVIVAARNEARHLRDLLTSLVHQNYPAGSFEVIVVNDRSTDDTASIIASFRNAHPFVRQIDITENRSDMPNKKNALRKAISESTFDILVFTDADCIAPASWLRSVSDAFTDDVGIVAGYSPYREGTAGPFLRYEEMKNSIIAAAAVGAGSAYMCTGRNLAYRKSVFEVVGGFEPIKHSVSGDDDLFLQLVQRSTPWKIRYMTGPESYVTTLPPQNLSQFFHQRVRHLSASSSYPRTVHIAYGISHLFHLVLIAGFFISPLISVAALAAKYSLDGLLAATAIKLFDERTSVAGFFMFEPMLVLYTFLIGPLGFFKPFQWKGTVST